MKRMWLIAGLMLAGGLAGCSVDIDRHPEGSYYGAYDRDYYYDHPVGSRYLTPVRVYEPPPRGYHRIEIRPDGRREWVRDRD